MKTRPSLRLLMLVSVLWAPLPAMAQQITGTPGSPSATTTIDGNYIPNPPPAFGGEINLNAKDSKPWWPPNIVPPKGAPNILLIMTDDQGYGISGTFGGVIPTPTMDRIAKMGLRYTQFHSTALCSPSRAAIITGRNHHAVGFGVIAEQATGYPGYDAIIGVDNATIGEILKDNGYATSWFGKNHNTPDYQYSTAGPFGQWPTGMGFEYFYGFMGGETDQWTPFLFRNTTQIFPWRDQPGYNMITGMADDAIQYLKQLNAAAPDKPFLLYYVPGGSHAPHQPTPEWIEKFKGKFDMGWNELREQIFANQKRLGVIPPNTTLTPWPDGQPEYGGAKLAKWDTLSADEKKLFARQAEVFAAYVAYTDHEIGRVIQAVDDMGKLDNTLVIYISGDNGTSAEGTTLGTPFDLAALQGIDVPVADQLKYYDVWGSAQTTPHMAVAWSWAFDTPFKWTKQIASHFGGTRQGMVIAWPNRIKDAGGIRTQFHHLIDIVPTILDVTGIPAPKMVNGIAQKPIEGVSMAYTFDKANADAPSTPYHPILRNDGQSGHLPRWLDGFHDPASTPVVVGPGQDARRGQRLQMGTVSTSPRTTRRPTISQPRCPTSCARCRSCSSWKPRNTRCSPWTTAYLARVLAPKPSYTAGRTEFTYAGELTGTPNGDAPNILAKSYTIVADVEVPSGGGEGMIVTDGGRFGGYGLYLLKGKPVFTYNLLAVAKFRWEGQEPLTPGKHTLKFDFKYDGPGMAKGGTGVLSVDGKAVANKSIDHTTPVLLTMDETFDIGSDTRTPVDDADYQVPFPFTGTISKVGFKLGPPQMLPEDSKAAQDMKNNADK